MIRLLSAVNISAPRTTLAVSVTSNSRSSFPEKCMQDCNTQVYTMSSLSSLTNFLPPIKPHFIGRSLHSQPTLNILSSSTHRLPIIGVYHLACSERKHRER